LRNLERIDTENEDFLKQSLQNVVEGKYSIQDILGFRLREPTVFIPRVACAHVAPSVAFHCPDASEHPAASILALLPLYNTLVYPIIPNFLKAKMDEEKFRQANDLSLKDFLKIVEKGRIVPHFVADYKTYDIDFVQHFLEPGLPRISSSHMGLIRAHNGCKLFDGDCKKCMASKKTARRDVPTLFGKTVSEEGCAYCLGNTYDMGITRQRLLETRFPVLTVCAMPEILACRNMGATFQTNCPIAKEALGLFAGIPEVPNPIEAIVEGLKVKYTKDLDMESYLDLLDGKTTRAVREVVRKIMEDPFASKYSEQLNARIVDFNREVEEVSKSKAAKFFHAVSDISVYGGSKFVERKAQGYLRASKKDQHKVSEWIASKLMDYHAKATGKDWTIAQLYRTRWKIEQCRKATQT